MISIFIFLQWDGTVGKWSYFDHWAHEGEKGEQPLTGHDDDDDDDDDSFMGPGRFTRRRRSPRLLQRSREQEMKESIHFKTLYD